MRIPVWLTLGMATMVILWGSYRIWLSVKPAVPGRTDTPRRGLSAMGKRTHLLVGLIYLLLGGALIATTFGWNPFGNSFGPDTQTPTKANAPTKGGIPVDQLPAKK